MSANVFQPTQHLAVLTLVFPHSRSKKFPRNAPLAKNVPIPDEIAAHLLPSTLNLLHPISQDTNLAFSVPFEEATAFLREVQELPTGLETLDNQGNDVHQPKFWVVKTVGAGSRTPQNTILSWSSNAWMGFVDLIKVYIFWLPTSRPNLQVFGRTPNRWISSLWPLGI